MKNLLSFIKKYWLLVLVLLTAVLYIVNLFVKGPKQPVSPTPTPANQIATFKNLLPGASTQKDASDQLGSPIDTKTEGGQSVSDYKSTNQYRFNQVTFDGNTATFIKEVVNSNDNITVDSITSTYGAPPYTLYNKSFNVAYKLFVYPQNGIAYLAHRDGTLLEVWYFQPTTIDKFTTTWAVDYSQNLPSPDGQ